MIILTGSPNFPRGPRLGTYIKLSYFKVYGTIFLAFIFEKIAANQLELELWPQ